MVCKRDLSVEELAAKLGLEGRDAVGIALLGRVYRMAQSVFGDEDAARRFLQEPHPMLGGEPPLERAIANEEGAESVINLLGRAAYGGAV